MVAAVAAMTIVVAAVATAAAVRVVATAVTDTKRVFLNEPGTFHEHACALRVLN
jgi:hypothetical protein